MDEIKTASQEALRELLNRTSIASREFVEWVTLPIAVDRRGEYTQHRGTAVLLQIGTHFFLLTAAHVFQDIRECGERPFLLFPYKKALPIPLTYSRCVEVPVVDIAIAELDERIVDQLKPEYHFMQLSNVWSPFEELGMIPSFMLTGFAGSRTRSALDGSKFCDPWRFRTGLYDPPTKLPGYDPDRHWILDYPDEILIGDCGRGYNIDPPGMSGCGVWAILNSESIATWTAAHLKLAGLLLGWNETNQYVVGTKISVPLYTIWLNFPETRHALREFGVKFQFPQS